jgi:HAD superfamily hydrolase (TIGR01490 family)
MDGRAEAAFFDLDKTVIEKASMVAFGPALRRAGLLSRVLLVRAGWANLVYKSFGADEAKLVKMRDAVLRLSKGWDQRQISAIVRETLEAVVEPLVYAEALDLIREHKAAGRKVFIVSASPEEVVAPLARYVGADEAIASRAMLDEHGRYSGEMELYCYGPEKATILERIAARDGIDLSRSYAYSDSATDLPMLLAVGHPVAVNPDRELARVAAANEWDVVHFRNGVPLWDRVPRPSPAQAAVGGSGVALAAGAAAAGLWWYRRRVPLVPVPPPTWADQVRQLVRSIGPS